MNPIPELLVDGLTFPECGRWHDNRLWFSDIDEGRVKAVDGAGHCETVVEAPGSVSGLGWTPNGDLLIGNQGLRRRVTNQNFTVAAKS